MTQASDDYRPLVRVRHLRFRYAGEDRDVLAIPALDIAGSGLTALVGASGAGKSTLVELLAGTLREPYEGTIETLGVDIRTLRTDAERQRHLRRIGFIPQDFGLLPGRTIRQILEQDLADAQVPREERAGRITSAAEAVGLTDFLDRQSNLLSGGQRQRAAIARMLARDVELVIADEPTANLDPERARGVLDLFRQMAISRPVIIVTHDPWLASECQRTVLLQAASTQSSAAVSTQGTSKRVLIAVAVVVAALLIAGGGVFAAMRLGSPHNVVAALPPRNTVAPTPTLVVALPPTAAPATPTPWPFANQPENCAQLSFGADGNISPAVCPDGHPNLQAILYFAKQSSKLLSLGRYATPSQVETAACQDMAVGTIPITTTEAQLAWAENNWSFGGLTPDVLQNDMVNGNCSPAAPAPVSTQAPFGTCQLYVPGKAALISVAGSGVGSAACQALIPYLVHNQWYLIANPESTLPTTAVRCDVSTSLLPSGASGVVTDTGEFSTTTGDNACADLGAG